MLTRPISAEPRASTTEATEPFRGQAENVEDNNIGLV
jgi:hypothetical protein